MGAAALERFRPVLLLFAAILLGGSYKILSQGDEEEEEESIENNSVVKFVRSWLPVTESYHGDSFFVDVAGVRTATPLLLVLAVIEISDLVFAVDSIPAVFGVTNDPFIVYSSNMFAIAVRPQPAAPPSTRPLTQPPAEPAHALHARVEEHDRDGVPGEGGGAGARLRGLQAGG